MTKPVLLFSVFAFLVVPASAENWPCWRGPRGDGTSIETDVPMRWNGETGAGIVWKVPVPGVGHSSPIVFGQHLFVTTCDTETQERSLHCYDTASGDLRWKRTVISAPLEFKHKLNSFASGTPAADSRAVYVSFLEPDDAASESAADQEFISPGKIVVAAYDFDGQQLWITQLGAFSSKHGFCSSPVLYENLVIINGDHDGDSYIAALDVSTGKTVWQMAREHRTRSYVTPLLREVDGEPHLVFSGSKQIVSLDPRDGSTRWVVEGPTEQFVASMVYDGEKFYMTAGFPTHHVMGIRNDGDGDVTDTHVAWHSTVAKCYVPSPVVVGNRLFVADDRGIANCFDTATGDRIWRERMGRHYSSSLVEAGGLVYFTDDDGVTKIIRPGDKAEILVENELGQNCYSSFAISEGQIYVRGQYDLFRIGSKP